MIEAHCNTRNIKFCNLDKTTLIERNFELNARHVKVCFRDESLREKEIVLRIYANI